MSLTKLYKFSLTGTINFKWEETKRNCICCDEE